MGSSVSGEAPHPPAQPASHLTLPSYIYMKGISHFLHVFIRCFQTCFAQSLFWVSYSPWYYMSKQCHGACFQLDAPAVGFVLFSIPLVTVAVSLPFRPLLFFNQNS